MLAESINSPCTEDDYRGDKIVPLDGTLSSVTKAMAGTRHSTRYRIKRIQRLPTMKELLSVRFSLRETAINEFIASRDQLICDFMRYFLLRINEAITLNLLHFDFVEQRFFVDPLREKTRKEKEYSLSGAPASFLADLTRYIERFGHLFRDGFLFPSQKKKNPFVSRKHWMSYRWVPAVKAAGLYRVRFVTINGSAVSNIRTHHWRMVGITQLIEQGLSPRKIAAFTGQHILTIMQYYWRIEERQARVEVMKNISAWEE